MICKKCGKYNSDSNKVCIYCGEIFPEKKEDKQTSFYDSPTWRKQPEKVSSNQSKKVEGVLLCLFLSFIGLIIGLIIYGDDSYEKSTFLEGWCLMFFLALALVIFIPIINCFGLGFLSCIY